MPGMEHRTHDWLDQIVIALADARAALASFGVHHPALVHQIETALVRAKRLKTRSLRP
jgi:hypothetical protein